MEVLGETQIVESLVKLHQTRRTSPEIWSQRGLPSPEVVPIIGWSMYICPLQATSSLPPPSVLINCVMMGGLPFR